MALLADHELAASTFAARMAASVRANPYAVVATGLGALGEVMHSNPWHAAVYTGPGTAARPRSRSRPCARLATVNGNSQQFTEGSEAQMAVRRLNHAVLYVHGLERTVEFYRHTLGFEVRMEIPGRAAFLRAPDSANDHDLGLFEIGTGQAPDRPEHPGLYHLAWEVGTLADLIDTRAKLVAAGALVGESDHRVSKSLYAKDPSGIEFEVLWRVPVRDWEAEMADGGMTLPLDWDATLARWGRDQATGAAAGSPT